MTPFSGQQEMNDDPIEQGGNENEDEEVAQGRAGMTVVKCVLTDKTK